MSRSEETAPTAPSQVDVTRPSSARIYDWYLDGRTNYAIDREFGAHAVERLPVIKPLARSNRRWLGRVVRSALREGIEQFWDLGSGVPTVGNVHEIVNEARLADPRVLYVDYEHVAVAHCQTILDKQGIGWADIVQADLREPRRISQHPATKRLLDGDRPVCLILASVLHFVGGEASIPALLAEYRRHLPSGSWIALSHITTDDAPPQAAEQITALAEAYRGTQNPAWLRDRTEFASWFDGLELVEPGIVHLADWRPESLTGKEHTEEQKTRALYWAGVGRVP